MSNLLMTPISDLLGTQVPVQCTPDTLMHVALDLMRKQSIGSVVITENGIPVGIFTERDYLKKVDRSGAEWGNDPIKAYMTPQPKTLYKTDHVSKALTFMRVGRFRHLVIVNDEKRLVAILSIKDLLDFLADSLTD